MNLMIILTFSVMGSIEDLTSDNLSPKTSYTSQILINGFISAGFGLAAGMYHLKGNDAYIDYKNSTTIAQAHDNWDRTILYDNIRNVCLISTLLFAGRSLYYYVRLKRAKEHTSATPLIKLELAYDKIIEIGIQKRL